jgi:hypothetical protein
MTATVLVQDDHQTSVLGVNNLCRPGTQGSCLGEQIMCTMLMSEPIAGKIDPGDSEW